MRVLMINSVCGIRSTGRICTDIATVLQNNMMECQIAYGREQVPERYQDISRRIGSDKDVKCHAVTARVFDCSGFGSKMATARFLEWVEEWNPDIIHLHNIHGYYINVEQLFEFLRKINKPIIWTLHDCWAFTGHCAYFDFVNCHKWKKKCRRCPQKRNYPSSMLFDFSSRNYKRKKVVFTGLSNLTIVTPSYWLSEVVKKSFLKDYPVKVIHNGIDLDQFSFSDSDVKEKYEIVGKKMILAVADGWGARKGLGDIISLAKQLNEEEKLVVVGITGKEKVKIPDNVIAINRTNNVRELVDMYSAADVLVNTTYEDNYPTVNLEAQACGTPVITYRTGGSVESVPSSNIVEVGDVNSMVQLIRNSHLLKVIDRAMLDKNTAYNTYLELYHCVQKKYTN